MSKEMLAMDEESQKKDDETKPLEDKDDETKKLLTEKGIPESLRTNKWATSL